MSRVRPSGAQGLVVGEISHGARHREGLERHGEDLAVCLLQRAAADFLRRGELFSPCCSMLTSRSYIPASVAHINICEWIFVSDNFCSIRFYWPRLRSTPARTERRLQRFSLRPSTFLLSSSPCKLCWACKNSFTLPASLLCLASYDIMIIC